MIRLLPVRPPKIPQYHPGNNVQREDKHDHNGVSRFNGDMREGVEPDLIVVGHKEIQVGRDIC